MRHAASHRYKICNFGRSEKGTGWYHFKAFEPKPRAYRYYSLSGRGIPETSAQSKAAVGDRILGKPAVEEKTPCVDNFSYTLAASSL
jgi:hypothetical protein